MCASVQESRDLKTINKSDGKIVDRFAAMFLPEHVAPAWPPMIVASHSSAEEHFSRPAAGINARIVLGSFRASAEMYLSEWRNVVQDTFGDHMDVELVALAVCDVAVCPLLDPVANPTVYCALSLITVRLLTHACKKGRCTLSLSCGL